MPADVITARTAPPAITPVPSGAGFSSTIPEPKRPSTVCGTVVCVRLILMRFFFAASIPLRMACGTSFALPDPKPTTAADGSPTTTSAANDMFLPPLTTFVTRLIETTWSFNWNEPASSFLVTLGILKSHFHFRRRSSVAGRSEQVRERQMTIDHRLELQSRLARRIRQRLHAAVINVAAAIEHDLGHALFLGQLGDLFSYRFRRSHVAPGHAIALAVVRCRGRNQRLTLEVVNQLHVNMVQRAVPVQSRTLRRSHTLLPDPIMHPLPRLVF